MASAASVRATSPAAGGRARRENARPPSAPSQENAHQLESSPPTAVARVAARTWGRLSARRRRGGARSTTDTHRRSTRKLRRRCSAAARAALASTSASRASGTGICRFDINVPVNSSDIDIDTRREKAAARRRATGGPARRNNRSQRAHAHRRRRRQEGVAATPRGRRAAGVHRGPAQRRRRGRGGAPALSAESTGGSHSPTSNIEQSNTQSAPTGSRIKHVYYDFYARKPPTRGAVLARRFTQHTCV